MSAPDDPSKGEPTELDLVYEDLRRAQERIAELETWVRDGLDTVEDDRHRHRGEALLEKGKK